MRGAKVDDRKRTFRFGVVGEGIRSGPELVATARRAEELGYDTLLLRDHFVAAPFGDQLAPMVALMAAAAATRTLRVGTLVLDNDYRHPVLLAKEAATLDLLSGGRFELGIGAGWARDEYERAGMAFDPPGIRVDRLEEAVRVLKGLFAGSVLTSPGHHSSVTELQSFPMPAQRPHPPILIGAGSRRMLSIAGREADIVGILPRALPDGTISDDLQERSPAAIAQKVEWVRQAAGDRFGQVELSAMVSVVVADNHHKAAEQLAVERGWGSEAAGAILEMPSILVGSVDRIADDLQARRDRFHLSYYVVSDEDMEAFASVIDRLAGT
jgi:probable F420-dependent oxidoreductase